MKHVTLAFLLQLLFASTGISQRINTSTFIVDVDNPHQFHKELIKENYRSVKEFTCSDTILNKVTCPCKRIESYNDSGVISKLQTGPNILNDKINMKISYVSVTDTLCVVITEYTASYIDSNKLFMIDTVIKNKNLKQDIYKRESNGNLIIKSISRFNNQTDLPTEVRRYDKYNTLKEIDYPLGNRKILKEWNDTIASDLDTTYVYNLHFEENVFQSYRRISKATRILENGYSNKTKGWKKIYEKTIFGYNDSFKLINKNTYNEENILTKVENYNYINGIWVSYIMDENPADTLTNEIRLYNASGRLTMLFQRAITDYSDTWQWNYLYRKNLAIRADYYEDGSYKNSTFYVYE